MLILAELNYRFVEMPGRRHGIRLTSRVVEAPVESAAASAELAV